MMLSWGRSPLAWLAHHPDCPNRPSTSLPGPDGAEVRELCERLLTLGGSKVAVRFDEMHHCGTVLHHGQLASTNELVMRRGELNYCHDNSASLWEARPDEYRLTTGYALSGGCWRRHTWLLDSEGRIVETTHPAET